MKWSKNVFRLLRVFHERRNPSFHLCSSARTNRQEVSIVQFHHSRFSLYPQSKYAIFQKGASTTRQGAMSIQWTSDEEIARKFKNIPLKGNIIPISHQTQRWIEKRRKLVQTSCMLLGCINKPWNHHCDWIVRKMTELSGANVHSTDLREKVKPQSAPRPEVLRFQWLSDTVRHNSTSLVVEPSF